MKKLLFAFISILICVTSCTETTNKFDLSTDQNLTELYSADEIKSLQLIVAFSDSIVMEKTNQPDVVEAYHQFFEMYADRMKQVKTVTNEEKYDFLCHKIDKDVFNSIWVSSDDFNQRNVMYGDTMLRNFKGTKTSIINPIGRFVKYLEKIKSQHNMYNGIWKAIDAGGGLGPASFLFYSKAHNDFDYTKTTDRLFATFLIISQEENLQDILDRYFEKVYRAKLALLNQENKVCLDKGLKMLECEKVYYQQLDSLLNDLSHLKLKSTRGKEKEAVRLEQEEWKSELKNRFTDINSQDEGTEGRDAEMIKYMKKALVLQERIEHILSK